MTPAFPKIKKPTHVWVVYQPSRPKEIILCGSWMGAEVPPSPEFRAKCEANGFVLERRAIWKIKFGCLPARIKGWPFRVRHFLWRRGHRHIFQTGHMYTDEQATALSILLAVAIAGAVWIAQR